MSNKSRLVLIAAVAGASVSSTLFAQPKTEPGNPGVAVPTPDMALRVGVDAVVDDPAALALANKLGLNRIVGGSLRGLPSCPDPISDGFNCHAADLAGAANFSNDGATNFRTMDNFEPLTSNPTRICWVGRYAGRAAPLVADESFRIRIFADQSGFPNLNAPIFERVFTQTGTAGNNHLELSCLDGQTCPGTTQPAAGGHYIYSAEVTEGFPLVAGGCYWVEISCVGSANAGQLWGWCSSQNGTDLTSLQAVDGQYTLFTRAQGDRAFCVSGGLETLFGTCVVAPQPPVCTNDDANGIPTDGVTGTIFRSSLPGSNGGSRWTTNFQMADNFRFDAPKTVSNICITGYWGITPIGGGGVPPAPAVPDNMGLVVTYFQNAGNLGVPGAPVNMASFALTDPGVSFQHNGNPADWDISITHPAVNFSANTCYWVSVARVNLSTEPEFFWYATTGTPPAAENRLAYRVTPQAPGGAPGAWTGLSGDPIYNLPFLLNAGPVVAPGNCITAAPCQIPIPPGVVQENEANCGGGVIGGDTINGGCNSTPPVFSPLACGQTIRGTVAVSNGIRDTDWYQFTITQPRLVTVTVNAEFIGLAAFAGSGGIPTPNFVCGETNPITLVSDVGNCSPVSVTATLQPGTYTFVVAPDFSVDIACGSNVGSEYTLALTCADVPAPPANDLCANAIVLNTPCAGTNVTASGSTISSTPDGAPACGSATAQTAGGVWYRVVGNGSPITASTCATVAGYDAQVSVYTGSCGVFTCVAGDDDGCGTVGGMSTVTWNSTSGTTYYILMHGWDNSTGNFSLVLSSTGSCGGPTCSADWNNDGLVNSGDITAFLSAWLAGNGDFNNDGLNNSADITAFLTAWLAQVGGNC